MKYLDRVASGAVIVAVVVFLVLVAKGDFSRPKFNQPQAQDLTGKTVSLPGLKLPAGQNSLVLVVSTTCHFCKDSLPFYKQLTQKLNGRLNVVAILPQPVPEAQKFLKSAGVTTNEVVSATPEQVGVRGTPTVLLVDSKGKVSHVWVGELDQNGQQDLVKTVLPS